MKSLRKYTYLHYQSSFKSHHNCFYYNPLILTYKSPKRFCSTNNNNEERLKQSFLSKYQRKIQRSTTTEAWNRYESEQKSRDPQTLMYEGFKTPEFEQPKERVYNPNTIFGVGRATFRGLIMGIACFIGATLFVILRPTPISEDKEIANMHYFARLNADPSVHVTYSGLMYRIIEQRDLDDEEIDLHLLTNPNPDIHCVNIDYEGRFMNGDVFDSTFNNDNENDINNNYNGKGCVFPAKSLIAGIHQGLSNMTRESIFEFYLPPHLGYGERGSEFIPPHEPLVFKIKLNDFWKDQHLDRPQRFKLVN